MQENQQLNISQHPIGDVFHQEVQQDLLSPDTGKTISLYIPDPVSGEMAFYKYYPDMESCNLDAGFADILGIPYIVSVTDSFSDDRKPKADS